MSGTERIPPEEPTVDPDESPFEGGPVEGTPYKRGSVEDLAIQRVLARKAARERGEPDDDDTPFAAQPIEGMPYEDGSEEDLAIRRILGDDDVY